MSDFESWRHGRSTAEGYIEVSQGTRLVERIPLLGEGCVAAQSIKISRRINLLDQHHPVSAEERIKPAPTQFLEAVTRFARTRFQVSASSIPTHYGSTATFNWPFLFFICWNRSGN